MVARIVDSRARVARDGGDPRRDCGDGLVGDAGKLLSVLGAAEQLTERAVRCRHLVEMAVDQHIGKAAFLLHALGERFVAVVDVADIDDQVGLERFQRLEIDLGIATPGEPRNFTDAGQFVITFKAPSGTKLTVTEQEVANLERLIKEIVRPKDLAIIVDNIGVDNGFSAVYTSNAAMHTGFVQVGLKPEHSIGSYEYIRRIKKRMGEEMPELTPFFSTGSLVDAVVSMGAPAPIDVQVVGATSASTIEWLKRLQASCACRPPSPTCSCLRTSITRLCGLTSIAFTRRSSA